MFIFQMVGEENVLNNHHKSLARIMNEGENLNTLSNYKQATLKLFKMKSFS